MCAPLLRAVLDGAVCSPLPWTTGRGGTGRDGTGGVSPTVTAAAVPLCTASGEVSCAPLSCASGLTTLLSERCCWRRGKSGGGAVVAPTTAGTATTVPRPHQGATPLPGRAAGASRRLRPSLRLPEVVFLPKNGTVSAFTKQGKDLHSRQSSHHMVQGRLHVMLHRRWSLGRFRFAYNGCKP